jgi:hypothetical protein
VPRARAGQAKQSRLGSARLLPSPAALSSARLLPSPAAPTSVLRREPRPRASVIPPAGFPGTVENKR